MSDIIDLAQENEQRHRESAIQAIMDQQYQLRCMAERTRAYGICVTCGEAIPDARLRLVPYTIMCVECQGDNERRTRR